MFPDATPLPRTAPDRLFGRTCALLLGAVVLVAVLAHLALQASVARHDEAAQRALVTVRQAALARSLLTEISGLTVSLPDDGAGAERSRIARSIERLTQELQGGAASRPGSPEAGGGAERADLLAAVDEALALVRRPVLDAGAVAELKALLETRLIRPLELMTMRAETATERSRSLIHWTLATSLALQAMGAVLLAGGIVLPARRRIATWIARTRAAEQESAFRLLHDPLSQMPNATCLTATLTRIAAGAARSGRTAAVLRINLDGYAILRETLGAGVGNEIIRIAARRIQQALRACDFAARLDNDSFAVIACDLSDAHAAAAIAARMQAALSSPFAIRGSARRIGCCIGVTLVSDDLPLPDRIIANAEMALAAAQAADPGSVRHFDARLRREIERRETLYSELTTALETGQLVAFFQPQIALGTGAFTGFEALVRWEHPERGLLPPAAFLDFADQTGLTEQIGEEVLNRSLDALRAWDAAGFEVPRVGINFALAQLRDPRLIEKIKWEVERFDIEPSRISVEVLETVLIKSDKDMVVRNLRGLASVGFRVELDDFGTGHASIANLRRFMVDRIKIDRSFVTGIEASPELQTLNASMIAMAHALGIETLAEGVETEEARAVLRRLGCDHFQGFLVAKPMSLDDTFAWLRDYRPCPAAISAASHPAAVDPNTP